VYEQDHPLNNLIEELKKIPSVGAKSAQRMAFYIIGLPQEEADRLAEAVLEAKRSIFYCSVCHSLTDKDPCFYCLDDGRDDEIMCVVEEPSSVSAIERTGIYRGRYHVLQGALAPLKGMGPDELKIESLLERIRQGHFREVIIATNPTVDGEATAHFLAKLLRELEVRVTRLAMGLPVGSDLDYADQVTIKKSLEGRTELKD
jgi:recombination protein RecR